MNRAQILKSIFFLNAFLAFFVFAFAQAGFKLEVSSRSIGRDEVLQVSYTVTNASQLNSRISVTSFPGWKIVSGPQTSQETSIINGVTSSSIGYIYLLMPQKTGNLIVPGASVTADGKKLTCLGVTVHVGNQSSGGNGAAAPSGGQSSLQSLLDQLERQNDVESSNTLHQGESASQKIKDNMFVRATPSKRSVYVGEPFSVTYQLYSALGGQSKVTKQPSFNGVSVVEVNKEESDPEIVTIGNKKYRAFLIRKVQLTALQPRSISLGTMETSNEVPFASYDDPYHSQTYTEIIQNPAVTIEAKPIPTEGRPPTYSGAIGHFTVRVIPQSQSVPVGENDMLNVEITGDGNLLNATMPSYTWPMGIDHYDPKDSQHVDKSAYPFKVSKVFKVPFIGNKEGKATFGPISFSFFDPETGKYSTVQSDPFTVEFTPALPKSKNLGNAFGLDLSGDIAYWAIGAAVLLLLLILIISAAKRNKKKLQKEKIEKQQKVDADKFAPWNVDANKKSQPEKQEVKKEDTKVTPVEEPTKETIPTKEDYSLELQSIMLSTNKTEMYEKGNQLICKILAQYLHSPIEDKYALLEKLKNSEVASETKDKIITVVNNLNNQINRGLYSPLFSEEDKLNLIDGLNDLLRVTL